MLKGDLVTTPLPVVLRQLADGNSTGCLHVRDARDEDGRVFLRGGRVYAVQVPGQRPLLGQFLVSSGALGPEMLAEALEAQRTELQGWKLGELVVHLGYVEADVVEAFLAEQVLDQLGDLLRWPTGTWKFRVNERTREDVAKLTDVEDLLAACTYRAEAWSAVLEVVHSPEAVPVLSAAGATDSELAIDPEAWSLLCKVDGERTLAELALESGFTLYETGHVVAALVRAGLLEVEEPAYVEQEEPVAVGTVASRLAAAFAPAAPEPAVVIPQQSEPADSGLTTADDEASDRITAALSALLRPATDDDLFAPRPRRAAQEPKELSPEEKAQKEREARRRAADAAELMQAQAELEAARRRLHGTEPPEPATGTEQVTAAETAGETEHEAEIVSLDEARREAARRGEEEARAAEDARLAAQARELEEEKAALAAERARLEEEARHAEEERLRAAEEARLAEAARWAAEERAAEQARIAAERAQEEARLAEQARLEALEQERLEQLARQREEKERLAAEARRLEEQRAELAAERARIEEETRLAAEARRAQQAAEQARLAAEAEAARIAEEARVAAEQAAAEQAAAEAAEAARLAAEEQARLEEEAHALAEEKARLEAEVAEAARLKAEAEAAAAEEARLAEELRVAEETRLAEELRVAEEAEAAAAEQARADHEQRAAVAEEMRRAAEEQAAAVEAARLAGEEQERSRLAAEEQAEDELSAQIALTEQRVGASSAFAELSGMAQAVVPQVEPEPAAVVPAYEEPEPEPEPERPASPAADTDMASLFRELSSLGMDDEPAPSTPAQTPRPVNRAAPAQQSKKKKGLFGR